MQHITRRSALTAAAGLALQAGPVRLPQPVRVGIIGLVGHVSEITGPLANLPDVSVVAISDANSEQLRQSTRNPRLSQAQTYTDYRQMLEREKLDVVAVCNNNGERAEAILACATRKLNVIAEKPLAIHRKDFEQIRKAVTETRIHLGMLLPLRFDPPYLAMRQIVASGQLGDIAQIDSQKSYIPGSRGAWFKNRSTYGSTMLWIGIHMIDLMRWTSAREFKEAVAFQSHVGYPELGDMENVTASIFRLDNGGLATLRMDYLRPSKAGSHGDDRLRLAGLRGVVEYQDSTGLVLIPEGEKARRIDALPPKESVFVNFLESVYNAKPAALPLADIYRVNEITLGAHESSESGKRSRL